MLTIYKLPNFLWRWNYLHRSSAYFSTLNYQNSSRNIALNEKKYSHILNDSRIFSNKTEKSPVTCAIFQKQCRNMSTVNTGNRQILSSISESNIVESCQDVIINFHNLTGLPWWATIITGTILIRVIVTLPLAAHQYYIFAKLENIGPEMKNIAIELSKETSVAVKKLNLTESQARGLFKFSMKKQWKILVERENCHPFKGALLILFQIPLWISLSLAMRNIIDMRPNYDLTAHAIYEDLSSGGFGWITNLTQVDHYIILPVALGVLNLTIIELQRITRTTPTTRFHRYLTNFFRLISIGMIPIGATVPSCLCLYWVTSSSFGLTQNMVFLSPRVRRFFRIPPTPSELKNPYIHIKNKITNRL